MNYKLSGDLEGKAKPTCKITQKGEETLINKHLLPSGKREGSTISLDTERPKKTHSLVKEWKEITLPQETKYGPSKVVAIKIRHN